MTTKQPPTDFPEVQAAIYGVALSLDAFLLNGIPYGVLQRDVFPGFLEKTAGNLMRDLARLEGQARDAPGTHQPRVAESLQSLQARCQELVDLVSGLEAFRTASPEEVRFTVSRIPLLREECVRLIQELEGLLQTPRPFYQSRPSHSIEAMIDFLARLEDLFAEKWESGTESG